MARGIEIAWILLSDTIVFQQFLKLKGALYHYALVSGMGIVFCGFLVLTNVVIRGWWVCIILYEASCSTGVYFADCILRRFSNWSEVATLGFSCESQSKPSDSSKYSSLLLEELSDIKV